MAELSEQDRQRIWRGVQRYWSALFEGTNYSGPELRAAVDSTDTWIDANETGYNTALPEPFKSNATQAQKTLMFNVVAAMRVSPAFARKLIGEVD